MRIVGGRWRGCPLETVEGREVTRPTTDRMREAFASMVLSAFGLDLSDVSVLDAFAGSGALGLEMLSRGARFATFVERDRNALACLRSNVASLRGASELARVIRADAFRLATRCPLDGAPFGLVLLDPPYATGASQVGDLLAALAREGQLAARTIVLYERSRDGAGLDLPGLGLLSSRVHGATAADLMEYDVT